MNNVGKAGAILTIIGGALMIFTAVVLFFSINLFLTLLYNVDNMYATEAFRIVFFTLMIPLAIINLILGILDIVFASLTLKNKSSFRVTAGVFAIISIFFAFLFYFIPSIVLLIGGILLLSGKKKEEEKVNNPIPTINVVGNVS